MDKATKEWYKNLSHGKQIQYKLNIVDEGTAETYFIIEEHPMDPHEYFEGS